MPRDRSDSSESRGLCPSGRCLPQHSLAGCDDAEILLDALAADATVADREAAFARVRELQDRDDIFPDILASVEEVLNRG